MPQLNILLDGDDCWPDLANKSDEHIVHVTGTIEVALRPGAMSSGKAAVAIRIDLAELARKGGTPS